MQNSRMCHNRLARFVCDDPGDSNPALETLKSPHGMAEIIVSKGANYKRTSLVLRKMCGVINIR